MPRAYCCNLPCYGDVNGPQLDLLLPDIAALAFYDKIPFAKPSTALALLNEHENTLYKIVEKREGIERCIWVRYFMWKDGVTFVEFKDPEVFLMAGLWCEGDTWVKTTCGGDKKHGNSYTTTFMKPLKKQEDDLNDMRIAVADRATEG